jgi:hypothetical protein
MQVKSLVSFVGGVAMVLAIGGIANAGPVGIQRTYIYETYPQYLTAPQIEQALQQAAARDMQDARDGNKNSAAFTDKGVEANNLATRLAEGYPITVAEIDDALLPVHVW